MTRRAMAMAALLVLPAAVHAKGKKGGAVAVKTGYSGVTPEGGEPPAPPPATGGVSYVTWPGYRPPKKGAEEVFLQLSAPASYKVARRGRKVFVTLANADTYLKNNLRPVDTRAFGGVVQGFRLRRLKGQRLRLEITLARAARPRVTARKAGRYHYLIVAFSG